MHRNGLAAVALMAAVGATGCLVKETTHRLYLSPSGAVAWTVLEESVRSIEDDPARRWSEEQDWLARSRGTPTPSPRGCAGWAGETSTTLLRPRARTWR